MDTEINLNIKIKFKASEKTAKELESDAEKCMKRNQPFDYQNWLDRRGIIARLIPTVVQSQFGSNGNQVNIVIYG